MFEGEHAKCIDAALLQQWHSALRSRRRRLAYLQLTRRFRVCMVAGLAESRACAKLPEALEAVAGGVRKPSDVRRDM
jgi:hypothetical protein